MQITVNNKLLIIIGVMIILLFILFKGCYKAPDHKQDKSAVDSIALLQKSYDVSQKVILSLTKSNDSLEQENMQLHTEKAHTEVELNKSISSAAGYLSDYKLVKKKLDTALISRNPDLSNLITIQDSLNSTIETSVAVIDRYRLVNAQMDSICEKQKALMDQKAIIQADLIVKLKQNNDILIGKYNAIFSDYSKVRRKNKGNEVLTRILAGIALAAATLYLTK